MHNWVKARENVGFARRYKILDKVEKDSIVLRSKQVTCSCIRFQDFKISCKIVQLTTLVSMILEKLVKM